MPCGLPCPFGGGGSGWFVGGFCGGCVDGGGGILACADLTCGKVFRITKCLAALDMCVL